MGTIVGVRSTKRLFHSGSENRFFVRRYRFYDTTNPPVLTVPILARKRDHSLHAIHAECQKKEDRRGEREICNRPVIKSRNGLPTIPLVGGVTAVVCFAAHPSIRAFTFELYEISAISGGHGREGSPLLFSITAQWRSGVTVYPIFGINRTAGAEKIAPQHRSS